MTPTSILTLDSVSLVLPDGRPLFSDLNEAFDLRRTGLVGRNGVGKSLLGQVLAGVRAPTSGRCLRHGHVYYLGQQVAHRATCVAELAQIDRVIAALDRIEAGGVAPEDFDTVGERWDIRDRLQSLLAQNGLGHLDGQSPAAHLSGGEAMSVALLGAWASDADYLILDEPTNHLDSAARARLLAMIERWDKGLLVISHDRWLLDHMARIVELSPQGLHTYGGNYSFYTQRKDEAIAQAEQTLAQLKHQQQRQLRELQHQRERLERHQSRAARQAKHANQAKILVDRQQERSQTTAGKQRRDHLSARHALNARVSEAARAIELQVPIVLHAPAPMRHPGREVLAMEDVRLPHGSQTPLNLRLCLGERMGLVGANGSGKSTLLRLIDGQFPSLDGNLRRRGECTLLDQHCSLLPGERTLLEHLTHGNPSLDQAQLRTRLAQLGLDAARIVLPSALLSGGERLKGALAAILYRERPLDLLLLDEPGNHLDLPSLEALETMLGRFAGALLVCSHDRVLLEHLHLDGYLELGRQCTGLANS